jgi:hypothetical protein
VKRRHPAKLPELEYPEGAQLRGVSRNGEVKFEGVRMFASALLASEVVGLWEVGREPNWPAVDYRPLMIGRMDLIKLRLLPAGREAGGGDEKRNNISFEMGMLPRTHGVFRFRARIPGPQERAPLALMESRPRIGARAPSLDVAAAMRVARCLPHRSPRANCPREAPTSLNMLNAQRVLHPTCSVPLARTKTAGLPSTNYYFTLKRPNGKISDNQLRNYTHFGSRRREDGHIIWKRSRYSQRAYGPAQESYKPRFYWIPVNNGFLGPRRSKENEVTRQSLVKRGDEGSRAAGGNQPYPRNPAAI